MKSRAKMPLSRDWPHECFVLNGEDLRKPIVCPDLTELARRLDGEASHFSAAAPLARLGDSRPVGRLRWPGVSDAERKIPNESPAPRQRSFASTAHINAARSIPVHDNTTYLAHTHTQGERHTRTHAHTPRVTMGSLHCDTEKAAALKEFDGFGPACFCFGHVVTHIRYYRTRPLSCPLATSSCGDDGHDGTTAALYALRGRPYLIELMVFPSIYLSIHLSRHAEGQDLSSEGGYHMYQVCT